MDKRYKGKGRDICGHATNQNGDNCLATKKSALVSHPSPRGKIDPR